MYNQAEVFLFQDFSKKKGRGNLPRARNLENSSESCKSFPDLKLGYCPLYVNATFAAERQPGSDPSISVIAARSIRHL
jgi:hypothetical protein